VRRSKKVDRNIEATPGSGTRRVLLLSDTHGMVDARIAALVADVDLIVHAGDVGSAAVLAQLGANGVPVRAVRGNNDTEAKWMAADRAVLSTLPKELRIGLPGGELVVVHGDAVAARGRHARLRTLFPAARAVFYGHSHLLEVDTSTVPWVLNAGAAGRARTYGGPSCLLLTAGPERWDVTVKRFSVVGSR
jgi:putative phosphoesterase